MLRRLSKLVSKERLKNFVDGLFYSKLNYRLPVFGNVFGLEEYRDKNRRYLSFTMEDNRKLQVLQNSVMRLLTGLPYETPTTKLLQITNSLSIQQLIAKSTLMMVFKILQTSKPKYLAEKMRVKTRQGGRRIPHRSIGMLEVPTFNLTLSKDSFIA